jgi:23S rRNA (pseudouridine1915-N3)-methyltransferase
VLDRVFLRKPAGVIFFVSKVSVAYIHENFLRSEMKIFLCCTGKNHESYIKPGVLDFTKRVSNYFSVEWKIFPVPKYGASLSTEELKKKEGEVILKWMTKGDFLIALEEQGEQWTSLKMAQILQARANEGSRNLIFLIGGAYGLAQEVLKRANLKWSLSQLTFPHQLVRLILAEQLYRACTILKNEKYHHP